MRNNRWRRRGLLILGTGLILLLVFGAGFFVGRWSVIADGRSALGRIGIGAHSAIGKIVSIDGKTITLETREDVTQIVLINDATIIERAAKGKKIALGDLHVGDRVAVIGAPNVDGQLVARIISQLAVPNPGAATRVPSPPK